MALKDDINEGLRQAFTGDARRPPEMGEAKEVAFDGPAVEGGALPIIVRLGAASDAFSLLCPVKPLAHPPTDGALTALLRCNLSGHQTFGAAFGIDEVQDMLALVYHWPLPRIEPRAFADLLASFAAGAAFWHEAFRTGEGLRDRRMLDL